MRNFISFVALLATTGALSAQTLSTHPIPAPSGLSTVSRAGVFAGREVRSLPADTPILRPIAMLVEGRRSRASLAISPAHEAGVMGAHIDWAGTAQAADPATVDFAQAGTTGNGMPRLSEVTFRQMLHAGDAGQGTLVIEFKGVRRNRGTAGATVRIGDREIRFVAQFEPNHRRRVVIEGLETGDRGLPVLITISGFAIGTSAPGGFDAGISLRFTADARPPRACAVSPGQRSCPQGGLLRGAARFDLRTVSSLGRGSLALSLEGALPGAIGVTLLSRDGELGRIPFSDCPLLLRSMTGLVFRTDSDGNARTALRIPGVPGDLQFFVQQVTVKFGGNVGLQIASSNTIEVNCSR